MVIQHLPGRPKRDLPSTRQRRGFTKMLPPQVKPEPNVPTKASNASSFFVDDGSMICVLEV